MAMALAEDIDPDVPVVQAVQAGDSYALDELIRRHGAWVRSLIYGVLGDPHLVDDVYQQTWTSFWENRGSLRDAARWKAWLYRLARNAALDAGRERTRSRQTVQRLAESALGGLAPGSGRPVARPDHQLSDAERHAAVATAVRSLPAIYREPFVLRHVEGWSYREISEAMNLPVDTVETRLVRARRFLREMLDGRI